MYRVTFNRAYEEPRHIATAEKFAEALAAAKNAGALLHEGKGSGQDFVFDVSGHEGDHEFAITIETHKRSRP
jgi:hypothetical protein